MVFIVLNFVTLVNGRLLLLMITFHVIQMGLHLPEEMIMKYGLYFLYLIKAKVLILEKAWAKIFGSYERIEAGLTREALKSLTGAPTAVVWTDCPENELWDEVN